MIKNIGQKKGKRKERKQRKKASKQRTFWPVSHHMFFCNHTHLLLTISILYHVGKL